MASVSLSAAALLLHILGSQCGEVCYKYSALYGQYKYSAYCADGCCGNNSIVYCCEHDGDSTAVVVSGCVFGGLLFLGFLISLLVCCVCMKANTGGHKGGVVMPHPTQTNVAMVSTNMCWMQSGDQGYCSLPPATTNTGASPKPLLQDPLQNTSS